MGWNEISWYSHLWASTSRLFTACPIQLYCYVFCCFFLFVDLFHTFGPFSVRPSVPFHPWCCASHRTEQPGRCWACSTGIPRSQFEIFIYLLFNSARFISVQVYLRRIALGSSIEWLCWINQLPIDRGCNSHLEIELVSLKRMPLNNISLQWICCCLAPSSVLLSSSLPTLCSLFPTHAPEIHI